MNCHICKKHSHASLLEYPRIGGICEKCATTLVMGWVKKNGDDVKNILYGKAEIQNDFQAFVQLNPSWIEEKTGIHRTLDCALQQRQAHFLIKKNEDLVTRGLSLVSRIDVLTSLGIEMIPIPSGEFLMGQSDAEKKVLITAIGQNFYRKYCERERPQHKVLISDFKIGKTTVTVSQFKAFVEETGYRTDAKTGRGTLGGVNHWGWPRSGINHGIPLFESVPVTNVSWNDAMAFITWLKEKTGEPFRLPTEAEWEYACRAGTTTIFHFGDSLSSHQANFDGNFPFGEAIKGPCKQDLAPVGSYDPNAWGLYDMHGNVFEWCADLYYENYYQESPSENPQGPNEREGFWERIFRGGSWFCQALNCRASYRLFYSPELVGSLLGFRLAMDG